MRNRNGDKINSNKLNTTCTSKAKAANLEVHVPVLVVGAGPTGLTLACELARRHLPVFLIEQSETAFVGSRAKTLQPRTLEVFDDLGVIDRAVAGGTFHMPFRIYDAQGDYLDRDIHENERTTSAVPYGALLLIPQWRTDRILRDALIAAGGHVTYGTVLEGFEQDNYGVRATLKTPYGKQTVSANWLIGCDGASSTTRKLAGLQFEGSTDEAQRLFVADVQATGLDRDHWHLWRGQQSFLGMAPFVASRHFQLQATPDEDTAHELSLSILQEIVRKRTARADIVLSEPRWMSTRRSNIRMVNRYREGRILIAGDACHVHPPSGGQGMNTGIQDAQNLAWKLAAVLEGAETELLDTYGSERLPVATKIIGLFTKLTSTIFKAEN